jgi:hypothetical protein
VVKRAADTRRTGTDICMHSLTRSGNSMAMALVTAEALLNLATTTVRTCDMANRSKHARSPVADAFIPSMCSWATCGLEDRHGERLCTPLRQRPTDLGWPAR